MSDLALRVECLGKQYHLGRTKTGEVNLRDMIARLSLRGLVRMAGRVERLPTFWALKDLSFEIKPGEMVGIIGGNGAGKSTLLKILSRITEPTTGRAEIHGRVGSLLEVGTGFNPELTGRENIYLNGAILGMRRREIKQKFDEIVEFAEVEKFLDTPVKHYSSGMYMKLAFSVAAHLEPDILIVDEVLSVGDSNFQRKCMNKMESVTGSGRTVLFVSHNIPAVNRLCSRGILLHHGELLDDGPATQVTQRFLASELGLISEKKWIDPKLAPGNAVARLVSVRIQDEGCSSLPVAEIQTPVQVALVFDVLESGQVLVPSIRLSDDAGILIFVCPDNEPEWRRTPRPRGRYMATMSIPGNFLAEGMFKVGVGLATSVPETTHFLELDCVSFQVIDRMEEGGVRGDFSGHFPGMVRPKLRWCNERLH